MEERQLILIPALEPEKKLITLCEQLRGLGFTDIVIIDDGSGEDYREIFATLEELGCIVSYHKTNLGKGAALKTGIKTAIGRFGSGNIYITADADGQHLPEDIAKAAAQSSPDVLVLGVRDFSSDNVPIKSRWGNRISSLLFRIFNGVSCPDTQTGLRVIPARLEKTALETEGERYEYEMNFLARACHILPFKYVPINTVYEDGNKSSHFRPVADSVRVYGKFFKFMLSSLSGALTDILLYIIFSSIIPFSKEMVVFTAAVLARICSGIVNFTLNRFFAFKSKKPAAIEFLRYGTLFIAQMCASAGLVTLLSVVIPIPTIIVKIAVDILLFFLSYAIQKNWVFRI